MFGGRKEEMSEIKVPRRLARLLAGLAWPQTAFANTV